MPGDDDRSMEQVLVVDDDPVVCELLADLLGTEGYRPIVCMEGGQALAISKKEKFGVAFVDINLPDMNGLDLAAKLKEDVPGREVVFITGAGTIENAVQAIRIGAYDYLRKPFSFADLSLCLKRFEELQALKTQIRMAEQQYCDLVQSVPLVIFVLRADFQLEFINQACFSMLGYTSEEAVNDADWFLERIHPEDRDRIAALARASFKPGGSLFSAECRLAHKSGHVVNAIVRSISSRGYPGRIGAERLKGILVDITDRVFLEKALVQDGKLKTLGALSEEFAHEIRNPLVSIGGFARRLKHRSPDLSEVDIILRESERLEKLLEKITNYLKSVELRREECSVNAIIVECIDLLSEEIALKGVVGRLDLDPIVPMVLVDSDVLRQTFVNVIRNAMNIMGKGGILTIRSFGSDQNVHVDYRIPTQKRIRDPEKLILPFDEADRNLSLALCYRLLKDMGGLLSFTQETDLAVFTISLPKAAC